VNEAHKLGFERCIVPDRNLRDLKGAGGRVIGVGSVLDALEATGCMTS
jgi:predicted ATP-dependent serine protease